MNTPDILPVPGTQRPYLTLVILAAGHGTRMRSRLPKMLHHVAGVPMLRRVISAGMSAVPDGVVLVVSPGLAAHPAFRSALPPGAAGLLQIVTQPEPLGTGHAVGIALADLPDGANSGDAATLVLLGDHPLLTPAIVAGVVGTARESPALVTLLTCLVDDAGGYGRIDRDPDGRVRAIVERADDDPAARTGRVEINSGMMVLATGWAREALAATAPSPITGEIYLTGLVGRAVGGARPGAAWPVGTLVSPADVAMGVNDRNQLGEVERVLHGRARTRHQLAGVSLVGVETIFIEDDVEIGQDSTIMPHTVIGAGTRIGTGCVIGPGAVIRDSRIGDGCEVRGSTLTSVVLGDGVDVGPYAHLRPGTVVGDGAHVGTHAELKNATIETGASVGHFSYVGDARVGARTNIGAGVVTANYDGERKHQTDIGADAFIGSDTILRAPVRIGDRARTGAGSVVTKDVPDDALAVGVPARVIRRNLPRPVTGGATADAVESAEPGTPGGTAAATGDEAITGGET